MKKDSKGAKVGNDKLSQDSVESRAQNESKAKCSLTKKKRLNVESDCEPKKKKLKKEISAKEDSLKTTKTKTEKFPVEVKNVSNFVTSSFLDELESDDFENLESEALSKMNRNINENLKDDNDVVPSFGFSKILTTEEEKSDDQEKDDQVAGKEKVDDCVSNLIEKTPFLKVDCSTDFQQKLDELVVSPKPVSSAGPIVVYDENKTRPKRKIVLSDFLRSPYVQRPVVIKASRTKLENEISEFVFSATLTHSDIVFKTKEGENVARHSFESLCPGIEVHLNVISAWSRQLNYQETFKKKESPTRLFCSPDMLLPSHYDKGVKNEDRFFHFESKMISILSAEDLNSIIGIDLVFIPIVCGEHYYLMCFNMKTHTVEVIDSIKSPKKNYKTWPQKMRIAFVDFLISIGHKEWEEFKSATIDYVDMPWKTQKNFIDCGIFLMRHMETYFGDLKKWKSELSEEKNQNDELKDLRCKYVAKLLTSDINLQNASIVQEMKNFLKMNDDSRMILRETGVARIKYNLKVNVDAQDKEDN
ncbi:hypothetical protein SSX86_004106 [Deinandra increscens subsp. villosa]|uniref:Ubiquitin-like protease family profile domain-containing protein n=1 Tax=Deinandra increscens subsp. villosa TaxID=3103831 RepID=A0AAP0H8Q6_9ASTR